MLEVKNINFSYQKTNVINNVNFTIKAGQNVAIIGESGCGKSTLLQLIYGLYDLDNGQILWNNHEVRGPKYNLIPGYEKMKYLAQDYGLMPYITVAENIGKYLSNTNKKNKESRINELLTLIDLEEFANTKVQFLSGGQQQRVGIAKALALEPELLLLDEPFSNIDNFKKSELRRNLFSYLKEKKITCIIATHDSNDALSFSDVTIVMRNGTIAQNGSSKTVFLKPKNNYIASLFGEVNKIKTHQLLPKSNSEKTILIYSHELQVVSDSLLKAQVKRTFFKGTAYLIEAKNKNQTIFFEHDIELAVNQQVYLKVDLSIIESRT